MKKIKKIFVVVGGIILVLVIYFMSVFLKVRECVRRSGCLNNLKQIGLALHMYAQDNNKVFPDKLSCLYPKYVSNLKVFICPSTKDKISFSDEVDKKSSYIYVSGFTENDADDKVLAYDKFANHNKKAGHENAHQELFIDGHVALKVDR